MILNAKNIINWKKKYDKLKKKKDINRHSNSNHNYYTNNNGEQSIDVITKIDAYTNLDINDIDRSCWSISQLIRSWGCLKHNHYNNVNYVSVFMYINIYYIFCLLVNG